MTEANLYYLQSFEWPPPETKDDFSDLENVLKYIKLSLEISTEHHLEKLRFGKKNLFANALRYIAAVHYSQNLKNVSEAGLLAEDAISSAKETIQKMILDSPEVDEGTHALEALCEIFKLNMALIDISKESHVTIICDETNSSPFSLALVTDESEHYQNATFDKEALTKLCSSN
jgi:hypothetical protein